MHGACRQFPVAAATKRSLPFALTFRPFAELPEQSLLLCGCLSRNAAAVEFRPEFVELGLLQQFLRRRKALPSRQFLAEVNFLPFRMSRRLLELGKAREQRFYKLRDTTIAIARWLPIVRDENGIDRDGLYRLALINQIWIQGLLELRRGIDILKRSRNGDLQKVQIVVRRDVGEDARGLSGKDHRGGDFPVLDCGDRVRLTEIDLVDRNTEQSKYVARRDLRAGAGIREVHLLAVQLLDRLDAAACDHVHFFREHPGYIVQPLVKGGAEFSGRRKIAQHLGRGDSDIHPLQVQHITDVLCSAHPYDGQDSEVIVIEQHSEIVGDVEVGLLRASGNNGNDIGVELGLPLLLKTGGARGLRSGHLRDSNRAASEHAHHCNPDQKRPDQNQPGHPEVVSISWQGRLNLLTNHHLASRLCCWSTASGNTLRL